MQRILFIYSMLICLLPFSFVSAQLSKSVNPLTQLKEEQERFIYHLKNLSSDAALVSRLTAVIQSESNSIRKIISSEAFMSETAKTKAVSSYVNLLKELGKNISEQKFEMYDIPETIVTYKNILKAFLGGKPVASFLAPLNPRQARLMANAFWEYDQSRLLEEIAVYKLVVSSPEYVLQFLKKNPGFRFSDSLLFIAVSHNPVKTFSYINENKNLFSNSSRDIYKQQILLMSENKLASELMPFIVPLAKNEISPDSILEKRKDVTGYFQSLINTLKKETSAGLHSSDFFHSALRNGIKQKSLSFYVDNINELHNSPDKIRFASVNNLRPEDIYYIMTSCEAELYTSSYLGLYRRLAERLNGNPDSIFDIVNYDNFRIFMRMASNYNTLPDFFSRMPQEKANALLKRFISGIETDTDTGLEKAMDVADSFTGLAHEENIGDYIGNELKLNLERTKKKQSLFGNRLYSILLQVYNLVKEDDMNSTLWKKLGNYKLLERNDLQNSNGEIIEVVMFYGDEDGVASFNHFLSLFKNTAAWNVSRNKHWVTIQSLSEQKLVIYANLPLDHDKELDLQAQDLLFDHLEKQSLEPSIVIHRGHSYHLSHTMKRLQPSVKLAILGSCGGYNSIISVANISPEAHIIVSKKMGSKFINDPMIEEINETLLEKKDLVWSDVWNDLQKRFGKDQHRQNLFIEYIPPEKNVSLFVLKLFNSQK